MLICLPYFFLSYYNDCLDIALLILICKIMVHMPRNSLVAAAYTSDLCLAAYLLYLAKTILLQSANPTAMILQN